MIKTLTCAACRVEFTYDHTGGPTRQRCDTCTEARRRETARLKSQRWRENDPERAREVANRSNRKRLADPEHLRWKREDAMRRAYGLEPEDYDALLAAQDDRCAVCRNSHVGPGRRLHVDHDHGTGRIRGLLCGKCNTLLGLADDDPARLRQAIEYLEAHRQD